MQISIRLIIYFLVLLAVPIASYMYVFQPRNEDIAQAEREIEMKSARLDKLDEMVAQIDDIGLEIEKGRDAIELIEAKLPSQQDVEVILEQIWQLAENNSLKLRSVKSRDAVPAAMYMEQPLDVVMEGEFNDFYQFLVQLEELPRITRIHEMDLTRIGVKDKPDDNDLPPGSMRAEFTLSIYFEPKNAPTELSHAE